MIDRVEVVVGRHHVQMIQVMAFWRVGHRANPLGIVDPRDQGTGRFDDPLQTVPVFYCGDTLETCVFEIIDQLGVAAHDDAGAALAAAVGDPTDPDDRADAERDAVIAARARRVPPAFYERCGVHARINATPALAFDLTAVTNRTLLAENPEIVALMGKYHLRELDLHAVTAPYRPFTQAIANDLIRGRLAGVDVHGLYSVSRRHGYISALFCDGRFPASFTEIERTKPFHPSDPLVKKISHDLGLTP